MRSVLNDISTYDSKGDAFRYASDVNGKPNLGNWPEVVSLKNIKEMMDLTFDFLEGCMVGIEEHLDWERSAERE
jgi:hypothetical protein